MRCHECGTLVPDTQTVCPICRTQLQQAPGTRQRQQARRMMPAGRAQQSPQPRGTAAPTTPARRTREIAVQAGIARQQHSMARRTRTEPRGDIVGHVIAVDGPHLERADLDWRRALTRFLWLLMALAAPFLLIGGVLTTLGGFSVIIVLAGLYFIIRVVSPMNLLATLHLFNMLNPMGSRTAEQQVPVRYLRVRNRNNGTEYMARIKGAFDRGHIMQEDLVSLWGRRRSGTLEVKSAYNHRTNSWIAIEQNGSWVGLVITVIIFAVVALTLTDIATQVMEAANSATAITTTPGVWQ